MKPANDAFDQSGEVQGPRADALRQAPMMAYLLDALGQGVDIGPFGRKVFVYTARYFLNEDDLVRLLVQEPSIGDAEARALVRDAEQRHLVPPSAEQIRSWQDRQDFLMSPTPDDPASYDLYATLDLPQSVFDHIKTSHRDATGESSEHYTQVDRF